MTNIYTAVFQLLQTYIDKILKKKIKKKSKKCNSSICHLIAQDQNNYTNDEKRFDSILKGTSKLIQYSLSSAVYFDWLMFEPNPEGVMKCLRSRWLLPE